jgi:hypothetical protein
MMMMEETIEETDPRKHEKRRRITIKNEDGKNR